MGSGFIICRQRYSWFLPEEKERNEKAIFKSSRPEPEGRRKYSGSF
jgi:hypothetical protein